LGNIEAIASGTHSPRFICNRWDVNKGLENLGLNSAFTDFDFSNIENNTVDSIYYRVSKEKPVVHYIANQCFLKLKTGGKLLIIGQKNEGIKTYFTKIKNLFGGDAKLEKQGLLYAGYVFKSENQAPPAEDLYLDAQQYTTIRPVAETKSAEHSIHIHSKPGIFGWNKIDQGSLFLCSELPSILAALTNAPKSLLDLGCGYGYLSLMSKRFDLNKRWATDNNAAAVHAASHNFALNNMDVTVIADDCGSNISETFDLVLCNPPFHQGFSIDGDLTNKFLRNTHARLNKGGTAVFVVNQFIPLERKAEKLFTQVSLAADNGSFKLIQLTR
jgi:16S rRNA (guanine1207-N2)-methyltransferase